MFFTEKMIAEYVKCKDDPVYFIENYIRTVDVTSGGLIYIKLSKAQRLIIRRLQDDDTEERFVEKLLSRQTGKTFIGLAYLTHFVVFNEHKVSAVVGFKADHARSMLAELKRMIRGLPDWMRPDFIKDNVASFELENRCQVIAIGVGGYQALRGRTISFVYFDEFMYYNRNDWNIFCESFLPVLCSGKTSRALFLSSW